MNISWRDKYKPTRIEDIVGNKTQINEIEEYIKQFVGGNEIICPSLLVIGPNGVGKTLIVDLILKKYDFDVMVPDLNTISITPLKKTVKENSDIRTLKTWFNKVKRNTILSYTGEIVKKKFAVVFDDVSNICMRNDKNTLKEIVKYNSTLKNDAVPIIIISNNKHNKMINEIKKNVEVIIKKKIVVKKQNLTKNTKKQEITKIEQIKKSNIVTIHKPENTDLVNFIKEISKKENIIINDNLFDMMDIIIDHCQNDMRKLIDTLEDLKSIYKDTIIDSNLFEDYVKTSRKKDINEGIFISTGILLNSYQGIDEIIKIYGEERAAMPLMVHENYLTEIDTQYKKLSKQKKAEMICEISENISISDKIDGIIYSNQIWSLQDTHGFYSCVMPSFILKNNKSNNTYVTNKYIYTKDFNKTSIKKINGKSIKELRGNTSLSQFNVNDLLNTSEIIRDMQKRNDLDGIVKFMKQYDVGSKEIDHIIKIDKVNKTKQGITGKTKQYLVDKLEEDIYDTELTDDDF